MTQADSGLKLHVSPTMRWILFSLGWLFLLTGVAGIFLPILPTTPFILLAAACFARSSERFYNTLLNHKLSGPAIHNWRTNRCMAAKNKRYAYIIIVITFTISMLMLRERYVLVIMLFTFMTALMLFLFRVATCHTEK